MIILDLSAYLFPLSILACPFSFFGDGPQVERISWWPAWSPPAHFPKCRRFEPSKVIFLPAPPLNGVATHNPESPHHVTSHHHHIISPPSLSPSPSPPTQTKSTGQLVQSPCLILAQAPQDSKSSSEETTLSKAGEQTIVPCPSITISRPLHPMPSQAQVSLDP